MNLEEEIKLLSNNYLTAVEISLQIKCSAITVFRKREKYGIKLLKGRKLGKLMHNLNKRIEIKCVYCNKIMEIIPSRMNKAKYCSRKCMNSDNYYIENLSTIRIKAHKSGKYTYPIRNPLLPKYNIYKGKVYRLTEKTYVLYYDIINPNNYPRTLCGTKGGYQLDHIVSIKKCWNEGISVEEAASINNLQIIPWLDNLYKRTFECPLDKE